ncbi:hypothetical protein [Vibrio phage phiKT1028]|nr:hypothetical protein [Vibrio phage phiKT1028]
MSTVIQQISNTNLYHVHGTVVTAKGRPNRQNNIMMTIKGQKQVRLTRGQRWVKQLAKLREGFPLHLVDQSEHLCFKEIVLPTYEDYVVDAPYLSCMLEWEGLQLYVLPGFLGNAVSSQGKVYELYLDKANKEWYWGEIYPNQNECYDLINSIDGDMLELSAEDLIYLLKGDYVDGKDISAYYEKRHTDLKAKLALDDGWVSVDPKSDFGPEHVAQLHNDNVVVTLRDKPKTVTEAFLQAYHASGCETQPWLSRIAV